MQSYSIAAVLEEFSSGRYGEAWEPVTHYSPSLVQNGAALEDLHWYEYSLGLPARLNYGEA